MANEYHTGEITGIGTLFCDNCGHSLHFSKTGHIPPCPHCSHTRFHRED
jgi:NADH pyrophosphatase NudC (nudix superfamily)